MEKIKKWQVSLIFFVIFLTIYNILPTVFYYSQPLKSPVDEKIAKTIEKDISTRVSHLDSDTKDWIQSFCDSLSISIKSLKSDPKIPSKIQVDFYTENDVKIFRRHFPQAEKTLSHPPAKLLLREDAEKDFSKKVLIDRSFASLDPQKLSDYITFSHKKDAKGSPSNLYRNIVKDRIQRILFHINEESKELLASSDLSTPHQQKILFQTAKQLSEYKKAFGELSLVSQRLFQSLGSKDESHYKKMLSAFMSAEKSLKSFEKEEKNTSSKNLDEIKSQLSVIQDSLSVLQKEKSFFLKNPAVISWEKIDHLIEESQESSLTISLKNTHPFIKEIVLSWEKDRLDFILHKDALPFIQEKRSLAMNMILREMSRIAHISSEKIEKTDEGFTISLEHLENSQGLLAIDLWKIAHDEADLLLDALSSWKPSHPELQASFFPILSDVEYEKLSDLDRRIACVVVHPKNVQTLFPFLDSSSFYVVLKGIEPLMEKYAESTNSEEKQLLFQDLQSLQLLLHERGFSGYPARTLSSSKEFHSDLIFEKRNYFAPFLHATEEAFQTHGSKRYATLDLKDVEQRLLVKNAIETKRHNRLIEERDAYNKAKVHFGSEAAFLPKPKKSLFWNNLSLSFAKYFRGDERKILRWGLDLSGGKTVTLAFYDHLGKKVTSPQDLDKGISELEKRINRLGMAEIQIRREGTNITVDFPGSENFSAKELISGSSMFFHIANEQFSYKNPELSREVHLFLQDIWNEAKINQTTDPLQIEEIACKHLYGENLDPKKPNPKSSSAKVLYEKGLRLALPETQKSSDSFSDALSKVAVFREDAHKQSRQGPPLLIIFNNYALKGSYLTDIHPSYDPQQGNFLRFSVKGQYETKEGKVVAPKEALYNWTSQFAREKVQGTPLESYTQGDGFRMAVLLNGHLISAPTLDAPIKDQAIISGSFSQKEVNDLAFDLKAGSLSYVPKILSETNVSPQLGAKERTQGIAATLAALFLVIAFMSFYYRFAGVVASFAVVLNLLLIWALLQTMQATLTLSGIAGIVLTLGMAVDANVLVFERIKEELFAKKSLASAIQAGYSKAFSAILDANVTTIIAGLILLNFDSGPIKAFAITLIMGIISSMFSALFVTRVFFSWWVNRSTNAQLSMKRWIQGTSFPFLKQAKWVFFSGTCIIFLGLGSLFVQKSSILGLDFQGGYSLNVAFEAKKDLSYAKEIETLFHETGLQRKDFEIRELGNPHHLRIMISSSAEKALSQNSSSFEAEEMLSWLSNSFKKKSLVLEKGSKDLMHQSFSSMSSQLSQHVRNEALMGLALAFIGIFLYLSFRFEYSYAISAILCLVHDVIVSLALIAFLHFLGLPLQIDLHAIAAVMTIIGYSLNDTIIVFDRIREDLKKDSSLSSVALVNSAINATFSRTLMTSITTLISLVTLVTFGGSAIFNFSFAMTVGVVFGTLSSIFIAGPLLLFFHKKEGLFSRS